MRELRRGRRERRGRGRDCGGRVAARKTSDVARRAMSSGGATRSGVRTEGIDLRSSVSFQTYATFTAKKPLGVENQTRDARSEGLTPKSLTPEQWPVGSRARLWRRVGGFRAAKFKMGVISKCDPNVAPMPPTSDATQLRRRRAMRGALPASARATAAEGASAPAPPRA
jgi:hypothetical protein